MKRIPLFFLLILIIFSCKESTHHQVVGIQANSADNSSSQNLNFLIAKSYDELITKGIEIYTKEKDPVKAFPYFQTAWVKDSNRVDANYWLGCVNSIRNNDYNNLLKSLNYFNKAISINKNYRKALRQRGVVKMKIHDFEGALNDFNEAAVLDETDTSVYLDRHEAKLILKDQKGACEDLLKAKNLGSIIAIDKYKTTCR